MPPGRSTSASPSRARALCWAAIGGAIAAPFWATPVFAQTPGDARPIEFNRDIRPILADNCFPCHGPDKNARQADLRLDVRADALLAKAIVPHDTTASELLKRIDSSDPEQRMPPPKSQKELTALQRTLLRRWIESGAEYQPHWAFIPVPKEVPLPAPKNPDGWIRDPLDAFVLAELESRSMLPAEEATRERWLRRASFDLTGLPPSLEQLDAFLADNGEGAYARAAGRLLDSPAFGERMAADWLDAARYADTFGYQSDRDTHVWPWREWVIRAFNENLSYDQFILWQTAGDLLPNATREQRLATAFNRLHRQTNEGGSIEEEFRVAYVADRVVTNGTAFLGLTLECARCHDHKFDPIGQQDFYRLSAFFANIDEHGLYSHFTETPPTPTLHLYEGDQEARHLELLARIAAQEKVVATEQAAAKERFATAGETPPAEPPAAAARFDFDDVKAAGDYKPVPGRPTGAAAEGNSPNLAIEFGGDDAFVCKGAGQYGRTSPFTISLWLRPGEPGPRQAVLHRSIAAEDAAFRGYALTLDEGQAVFSLVHFWPGDAIRVKTKNKLPAGEWVHLAVTYDGSSRARGVGILIQGKPAELVVERDQLAHDIQQRPDKGDYGTAELSLGARFRDVGFKGGAIDDLRLYDSELTSMEVAQLAGVDPPAGEASRFSHYLARRDAPSQAAREALLALRREENELLLQVRRIMTMKEALVPRVTRVLRRGAYDAPGEDVQPDAPASILAFPEGQPRNRLGLARWMLHDQNPLVSRVAVNRFWQIFFGRGLVASPADFGSQGQPPTHPQLLDYLARDFMDHGWDVKGLCRRIVLSATYRQSSQARDPKGQLDDPDNRFLARGPRHRLSAEQLRDNALAVSGLLAPKLGGPSVFPYQPAGLWEESGTGKSYSQSKGEGLYRRSLYTFWRRTSPPPTLVSFDATSREFCVARRERTATPLQSLVLLNDPQFVEAARVLAERLLVRSGEPTVRAETAFRLLTSRRPTPRELELLVALERGQREHFAQLPDDARALLSVGEKPTDDKLDLSDRAATAVLVLTLMSYDESVTKR